MTDSLPILFMTKETEGRMGIAKRTIKALSENLHLGTFDPSHKLFYLCVYGSEEYYQELIATCHEYGAGFHVMHFTEGSAGYAWNETIKEIFASGHDLYLRMEDDFELKDTLDIRPYMELLWDRTDVGMVRLGLMPIDLDLRSVGWYDQYNQGHIFFDCLPSSPYAYSGNPGLVHKRMHDTVGYFDENHNPGDIEIDFDHRVRAKMKEGGPRIWWPLDLGKFSTYGPWDHIGNVKSY